VAVNSGLLLLKRTLSFPNDVLFILGGSGSWRLQFPVKEIVAHFVAGLPVHEADMIRQQLAQPHMHRWWLKGRLNGIYFYSLDSDTLLDDPAYKDCLFQIEMRVDGRRQRAEVAVFRGHISGVDLPKPASFYRGKTLEFGAVKRAQRQKSIAHALDRLEHGRGEDA
jgi:hypothetical protein